MSKTLRILNVEDSKQDVMLIIRHLSKSGYEIISEQVEQAAAMRDALEKQTWDVILCDYSMPQFSALAALQLLKETGLDIPFIIISGAVGEEMAVEAMRAGANDYLMKGRLDRLAPAIERELNEANNRHIKRQAEVALNKSEENYRHLLDTTYEGVLITNLDLQIIYGNQRLFEMLDSKGEELIGQPVLDLLEDTSQIDRRLKQRIQGVNEQYDLQLRRKDGSKFWVIANSSPVFNEAGEFTGVLSMLTDISRRKNAEDQLRESEARYRLLFESNPQPMWVYDVETLSFMEVNDAVVHNYGYSREELLSMTIKDIRPPEEMSKFLDSLPKAPDEYQETRIWQHKKKDGTIIDVEISAHSFTFNERPARLILANDVTERRTLEAQLRQSQKMEAIGQLAGGIAHDFNNLLTVINGYSELAIRQTEAAAPLQRHLEEILQAGQRAAGLTRQLLAFSRKQVLQTTTLDLNVIVTEIERMLQRLIGENIELRTMLESSLGSIKADPGQIEQIIMNLAVNARDAMPNGGKLTIETRNTYLNEDYARHHLTTEPGHYVVLTVSDNGFGMDAETQAHIFEPFFTTKETGKGTGLGLSTVYGIVKQSNGFVWVYSEVGCGTSFKVYLPRVDEIAPEHQQSIKTKDAFQGTETILLVEDEEIVRKLVLEILESDGYHVLEAENGRNGITICEHYTAPIHLVITDVIMPEMSGPDLADRLMQLRPEMKVLFMSGYTDNAIVHQGVLSEGTNFIQKPFTPDSLSQKVRRILDKTEN